MYISHAYIYIFEYVVVYYPLFINHIVDSFIEFAYGKVPLRADRDGGVAKVRVPGSICSRCFAESVFQKVLTEICEPKARQIERKGTVTYSK